MDSFWSGFLMGMLVTIPAIGIIVALLLIGHEQKVLNRPPAGESGPKNP